MKKNHKCGCITEEHEGIIVVKPCDKHREQGWVWIGMQHDVKANVR